jgi:hypothetical protein
MLAFREAPGCTLMRRESVDRWMPTTPGQIVILRLDPVEGRRYRKDAP